MKIGIFGGTFNPPHSGHITMARSAVTQLGLDKLLLIPDNVPPHKTLPAGSADSRQRLEMTALAAGAVGRLAQADDRELHRSGRSYSSDTLRELHEAYPQDELWLLMGSDMFLSLQMWHEPETVCALAHIAAFSRTAADEQAAFIAQKQRLEQAYGARIRLLKNQELIELSSTDVRRALAAGEGETLVPAAVWGYIRREQLYGTHTDLTRLTADELRPIALSYLKPKRMSHVLGTEREAVRLAERYGGDVETARVAALLHDCTKKLTLEEQLALCQVYGLRLDELERTALKLLHSRTGAELARRVFGVSDAVYDAIRWHTTGKADMSLMEKIIYLADYIEPNRDFEGVDALRQAVYRDLDEGLLLGLSMTIDEMRGMGNPVHHNTLDAQQYLLQHRK